MEEDTGVLKDKDFTFEDMGLDPRLVRALAKRNITKPTPIQWKAIPFVMEGKDIVARAKTGSGKTFAYVLPVLQKLFSDNGSNKKSPSTFILVPSRELCEQVHNEILSILQHCKGSWKVAQLTGSMSFAEMRAALDGAPEIIVATPACITTCLTKGFLQPPLLAKSLTTLILDEADLLLSYGYENDLKSLVPHVPRSCQCLLMSATSSADVDKLKQLILHSPVILTLTETNGKIVEIVPKSVEQFWMSCDASDRLLHILALLKLELVQKKVLIFVNSINMGFKLKLFLEQFGIKSAVLNAELPQNSRLHMLEEFNTGSFEYLIATDDSKSESTEKRTEDNKAGGKKIKKRRRKQSFDSEFGVVRGIDFKNVYTVINFDMPQSLTGYIHRIGRTGRANNSGTSISFVCPAEERVFNEIKLALNGRGEMGSESKCLLPFPLLTKSAIESLRYRAEDVSKSVTTVAVREARASELRNEILNSERLKAHFEDNPKDLELLKHDKILSKTHPSAHLRAIPDYLMDSTTKAASKAVRLAIEAMGKSQQRQHSWPHKKRNRSGDPLKTFSLESQGRRRKFKERKADHGPAKKKHKT
eukprot:TRINITY_DN1295_c0_g1_i1.p1 TRINITY_DN1295_c0_g1~~TRINITY_DN1295_c0_g1_i1.p1  ORF type:complete len:589 (+),score=118.29 TRINITY_DN1295_c0_g1_i1:418-2184(+)